MIYIVAIFDGKYYNSICNERLDMMPTSIEKRMTLLIKTSLW